MRVETPALLAIVGGALCAAACAWDPGLDGLAYACPDQQCPGGLVCVEGLCQTPAADAPPSGCAVTTVFVERFDSLAHWDSFLDGGTATATGALEIAYTESETGARVGMLDRYLTEGATITVDVDAPSDITSNTITMTLYDDELDAPQASFGTDTFDLIATIDGDTALAVEVARQTYQPQPHRFWRVRRGGGELCFETSANGTSFDPFGCGSDDGVRAELRVSLGARNYAGVAAVVTFDDLEWCGGLETP